MPAATTLSRLRTTEFFGALLPGAYILCAMMFVVVAARSGDAGVWALVRSPPPIHLFVAFVIFAYLVGTCVQSISVYYTDELCALCFRGTVRRDKFLKRIYASPFPYVNELRLMLDSSGVILAGQEAAAGKHYLDPIGTDVGAISRFNHWKMRVCIEEPETFALLSALEARTRMFVGLFWAGMVGMFASTIGRWGWKAAFVSLLAAGMSLVALRFAIARSRDTEQPPLGAPSGGPDYSLDVPRSARRNSFIFAGAVVADFLVVQVPPWGAPTATTYVWLISTFLALWFGWRLRYVRGHEAQQVFLAYIIIDRKPPPRNAAVPATT